MLFHYLRFVAFKDADQKEVAGLIKSLMSVSCADQAFLKQLIDLAETKDLSGCAALAATRTGDADALAAELTAGGFELKQVKDMNEIVDAYFTEPSPDYAMRMLETLLFFTITDDGTAYNTYIKKIMAGIPEDMKEMTYSDKMFHGFII